MGYLTYFPDDERFMYYGELPSVCEGVRRSYPDETAFKQKMVELAKKGMDIHGVVVMKGKEMIPGIYRFGGKVLPEKPLLSEDGSMLIFEKALSAGKFYLYSPDGNHRLVGEGGSVNSAAISPDGRLIAVIPASSTTLHTYSVSDRKRKHSFYLAYALKVMKNYEDLIKKWERQNGEKFIMISEKPSRIINQ